MLPFLGFTGDDAIKALPAETFFSSSGVFFAFFNWGDWLDSSIDLEGVNALATMFLKAERPNPNRLVLGVESLLSVSSDLFSSSLVRFPFTGENIILNF